MVGTVKFEARIQELVENIPDMALLVEPLLIVRRVLREQIVILHRRLLAIVRDDEVLVADGFDLALRFGDPPSGGLTARKLLETPGFSTRRFTGLYSRARPTAASTRSDWPRKHRLSRSAYGFPFRMGIPPWPGDGCGYLSVAFDGL